jgi:mono/diheme cytochrome c family protein
MFHVKLLIVGFVTLGLVASVAADAQDYSHYTGAQLYSRLCASCHGEKGRGDGIVASSLKIAAPELTRISARRGGQFPDEKIRQIIDGRNPLRPHGSREMPIWGYEFYALNQEKPDADKRTDEMVRRLVDYLKSLQRK